MKPKSSIFSVALDKQAQNSTRDKVACECICGKKYEWGSGLRKHLRKYGKEKGHGRKL